MCAIPARPSAPLDLGYAGDPLEEAHKEWLHLNVFDHASGTIGLINTSLHGHPRDPRAVAMGMALMYRPGDDWHWHIDIQPASAVTLGLAMMAMPSVALATGLPGGHVAASVTGGEVMAKVAATPATPTFDVPTHQPFGSGRISWSVVPRLRLDGTLAVGPHVLDLASASGYHDRNWGCWRWGDDIGWDWAALLAPEPAPVIVMSRATDRAHRTGEWLVSVHAGQRQIRFCNGMVSSRRSGLFDRPVPRLPGAMAALHGGRRHPGLPRFIATTVRDASSLLDIEFVTHAAAQIIAAEPTARGYTFLHELVGEFRCAGVIAGIHTSLSGLGVFEYVD